MPARDDNDPLVGQIIDRRYRVISRIGDGGMGIVYKVEHSYLNKLFALKVMRPTKDEIDRKRFEQEARLASSIRHPNVVEISDFGVLPTDQPYYVMEFLRGHTLGDAICAGQVDPLLACHIGAQICSGLQAVHRQNVVHRDLKPDNIFLVDPDAAAGAQPPPDATAGQSGSEVSEVRFVKIMDFGIAKSIDNRLTGAGMTVGTPEYMSPEQAQGERIDWRSDEYSLGCILYEMLTGTIPFDGKGAFEIMTKQLQMPPVPPRERSPDRAAQLTPDLEELVLRMMAKKKDQRIPSMRQIETTLRQQAMVLLQLRMKTHRLPASAVQTMLLPGGSSAGSSSQIQPTVRMKAVSDSSEMPTRHLHAIGPDGRPSMKTRQLDNSEQADMQKLIIKIQDKISMPSLPDTPVWYRYPALIVVVRWLLRAYEWLRRRLLGPRR